MNKGATLNGVTDSRDISVAERMYRGCHREVIWHNMIGKKLKSEYLKSNSNFTLNDVNLDKMLNASRSQFPNLENKEGELDLHRSFYLWIRKYSNLKI